MPLAGGDVSGAGAAAALFLSTSNLSPAWPSRLFNNLSVKL